MTATSPRTPAATPSARIDSLQEALDYRARVCPAKTAFIFLEAGEEPLPPLTFGGLQRRAQRLAGSLARRSRPGDRVFLLLAAGADFVVAFYACMYAGLIAVALPGSGRRRDVGRLASFSQDARPAFVITSEAWRRSLQHAGDALGGLLLFDLPGLEAEGDTDASPRFPREIAYLQYTSGSTSSPRGVCLTHACVLANVRQIVDALLHDPSDVTVSWIPHFHDMGLITGIFVPVYTGTTAVLMSPAAFIQRPVRWLEAMSSWGGTISGAPNFAYQLCVDKIPAEERSSLDLSAWRVAFSGAEPVRWETVCGFARTFEPSGFRRSAFYPCYGLAEASLYVTGGFVDRGCGSRSFDRTELSAGRAAVTPPDDSTSQTLVSCGRAGSTTEVRIVDPETRSDCSPDRVGEVWVAGPSVALGYWNNHPETVRAFEGRLATEPGRTFLRTGDLGILWNDELFIAGRLKDLIIIGGRNLYPQEIEEGVERAHPEIRSHGCAAFSVDDGAAERLVVVAETAERNSAVPPERIVHAVRCTVASEYAVHASRVLLVPPKSLPRTTSGKIRRAACREMLLAGQFER
jgi:acyl-CoA synthetase (AMP-forming)/AMP-acid ligase II